jgi:hypothetical protein
VATPFKSLVYQTFIEVQVDFDENGKVLDTKTLKRWTTEKGAPRPVKQKEKPKPATKKLQTQLQEAAEL